MGWKAAAEPVLTQFPSVERPTGNVEFRKQLLWTGAILLLYFFLTNILLLGLGTGQGAGADLFGRFRGILAGAQGSILQVGIAPIVTGSIVLQLLSGADLLGLDTQNDPRDQRLYQGLQKLLVLVMAVVTAIPMAFLGFLPPSPVLAQSLGVSLFVVRLILFVQIVAGSLLILYMDEVVSKWGLGSGVGLFIIAGISQRLFGGLIEEVILNGWVTLVTRGLPAPILTSSGLQALLFTQGNIVPLLTTVIIFCLVVYAESTRIQIPLSHSNVRSGRGSFPIKLIYASVLPMILVRAVQANIQFVGRILNQQFGSSLPGWVGVYVNGRPVEGLMFYLNPIQTPEQWMWWRASAPGEPLEIILRLLIDLTIMMVGGAIFAVFWVETTDMGAESSAKQIKASGMQIPGFRNNPKIIERVLARYIPAVTMLGGAIVGVLAVLANLLGTVGGVSGTGLLLSVSITYKLYEEVAEEQLASEMMGLLR